MDEADRDREAFFALHRGGRAERALHRAVSVHGMTAVATRLGVNWFDVLAWVRACKVPDERAQAVCRTGGKIEIYQGQRGVDPRRERLAEVAGLSVRAAAEALGVSRQTIARWRADPAPKPLGRPKQAA